MVKGFRSGFCTTSSQAKKEGRKQETTSQPSFFSQPQSFSSQQPGIQQTEQKQASKTAHTQTPVSAEKPRKQMKSTLHQEVQEFNPSSQMSTEQFIKAVLNLQEEVRKLKKANDKLMESNQKLMENLNKREEIDFRLMSQERVKNVLEYISESKQLILKLAIKADGTGQQTLNNRREIVNFQVRVKRNWNQTNENRSSQRAKKRREIIKNKKEIFLLRKYMTLLSEVLEILIEIKKLLDSGKIEQEKRRRQNEKNVLQSKRFNIQDQDGINQFKNTSKRKENLEKPELLISLILDVPNFFIQQQGA